MFGFIKDFIKMLVCEKELFKLARYERAAALAYRWNGEFETSAETARWIQMVGDGKIAPDPDGFRQAIREGRAKFYLDHAGLPHTVEVEGKKKKLKHLGRVTWRR